MYKDAVLKYWARFSQQNLFWTFIHEFKWVNAILKLYLEINADFFTGTCLVVEWAIIKIWYTETLSNSLKNLS